MRAIVTGGAGFIGSNLVDELVDRGDEVTVVDDLSTGRAENLDGAIERGAKLVVLDIRDVDDLDGAFAAARPQVVFHFAAQIDVRKSVADPGWDAQINVGGTINVLRAALAHGVDRVVNSSTGGAIYGDARTIPSTERTTALPEAPYGQSKLAAEGYIGLFERLHSLNAVTLRYGNVYGPRQDPLGEAGVIAIFCGKLEDGGTPTVYGDGRQTRDFVYVGDVVAANLAAATARAHGPVNIGTAVETSVLDIVEVLRELGGREDFQPQFAPARDGEIARSCLNISRARSAHHPVDLHAFGRQQLGQVGAVLAGDPRDQRARRVRAHRRPAAACVASSVLRSPSRIETSGDQRSTRRARAMLRQLRASSPSRAGANWGVKSSRPPSSASSSTMSRTLVSTAVPMLTGPWARAAAAARFAATTSPT